MNTKSYIRRSVSRSVYQKLAEENKRLRRDLRIICLGDPVKATILKMHWRARFNKEDKLKSDIDKILRKILAGRP